MSSYSHPLQIRDYRLFWLSRLASTCGGTAMVVVIGAQTYQIARSDHGYSEAEAAFMLGILGLVQFIPYLLFTPIAGLLADRMDRRFVASAATAVDLLIALVLAFANTTGIVSLPMLFVLAALYGAARVFINPSLSAIVPNIVPAELLPKAMAVSSVSWQVGSIVGPALAGFLLARNHAVPYWFSAGLLFVVICALLSIAHRAPPIATKEPMLKLMGDGARFVWRERFLLGCVTLDLFAVLLGGATAMLPAFAYDVLHVGDEGLGLMRAAPSLGAAVVAVYLSFRPLAHNVGAKMLWSVAVFGLATTVFGLSANFPLSLAMLALLGGADAVSVFIRTTLTQLNTPDEMRGRVSAISGLAISASNELGEMQSGLAAAFLGPIGAVALGGVGAIVVTAIWAAIFPELQRAKTFAPQYRQQESTS